MNGIVVDDIPTVDHILVGGDDSDSISKSNDSTLKLLSAYHGDSGRWTRQNAEL